MSGIVKRTRVAAWIARRRLAKLLAEALSPAPRRQPAKAPVQDFPRFPPF
jgi:hypothetical protein